MNFLDLKVCLKNMISRQVLSMHFLAKGRNLFFTYFIYYLFFMFCQTCLILILIIFQILNHFAINFGFSMLFFFTLWYLIFKIINLHIKINLFFCNNNNNNNNNNKNKKNSIFQKYIYILNCIWLSISKKSCFYSNTKNKK
jgi:hypothetical protein